LRKRENVRELCLQECSEREFGCLRGLGHPMGKPLSPLD